MWQHNSGVNVRVGVLGLGFGLRLGLLVGLRLGRVLLELRIYLTIIDP